ncbi:MAG: phosphoglucomutase, partial [Candidatus Hydrothermota bacterium]
MAAKRVRTKAVIMAGGFGTRIRPLTVNLPKPMLPLVGRPILEHIVYLLKQHGLDDIIMLLYYQPDVIKNYFGDGSELGVKIRYTIPDRDYGTAGAVRYAKDLFDDSRILVISGDVLTDFNLTEILDFHESKGAEATIALTRVENPLQFGIVITDDADRIVKFLEKPTWGEVFSDTVNTGIYVLEPSAVDSIPEGEEYDFSKQLFPKMLSEKRPLFGCIVEGYWRDIGDPDSYREAHYDIFEGKVEVKVPGNKLDLVGRDVRVGRDVKIGKRVAFKGTVIIGNNTSIHRRAVLEDCVIGSNCTVEEGVRLKRTIIWDNTYIRAKAKVEGAVVMSGVRIGEGAVIEDGAVIGDECSVGKGAIVQAGVKIWPKKVIEEGAVVAQNLVWGEKWRKSLFEGAKVTGLTNIELTPELCAKLGAAYGSILPKGAFVLTARDPHPSSRMLRRAFIGGLASTGVNIKDVQLISIPIFRFKLQHFGEIGGVYFRQSPDDPPSTEIHFYDANGLDIPTGTGKSIERVFYREDFRRAHFNEPGEIVHLPQIFEFYREDYLKTLDVSSIKERKFRIVIDFSHGSPAQELPEILNSMGVDFITLNAYIDYLRLAKTESEIEKLLKQLSSIVRTLKADAGFYLYPNGERLIFVDESGKVHRKLDLLLLISALVMETCEPEGVIAVPAFAPSVVEDFARKHGFTVRRISSSPRSMSEAAQMEGVKLVASADEQFIFPEFQRVQDGMFTIGKVLEMATKLEVPLSKFSESLPRKAMGYERVA